MKMPICIPLSSAYLCCDCSQIGNDPHRCACSSTALLSLSKILDRETVGAYEEESYLWAIEQELKP